MRRGRRREMIEEEEGEGEEEGEIVRYTQEI